MAETESTGLTGYLPVVAALSILAATVILIPPQISIGGGESFRLFASGFFLTQGDEKLSGDPEVRIRLTNPRHSHLEFLMTASPRRPDELVELRTLRNGREVSRQALENPAVIRATLGPNEDWVRLVVEAAPLSAGARAVYRVPKIQLTSRKAPWIPAIVTAFVAALLTSILIRGVSAPLKAVAMVAVFLAALSILIEHADPLFQYRFSSDSRRLLSVAASAATFLCFLLHPAGWAVRSFVALTVVCLYGPSLHYGFVNEDFSFARSRSFSDLASTLVGSWDPSGVVEPYFRPVVSATFALDFQLWGANPSGYHMTNLALVIASALLLALVLEGVGLARQSALAAAGLWLAHPLSASAITWPNQRTDLLALLFMLGTLAASLCAGSRARALSLAFLALGLASKEIAVVTPVLVAFSLIAAGQPVREALRRTAPTATLAALYFAGWSARFGQKLAPGTPRMENLGDELWRLVAAFPTSLFLPPDYERWWTVGAEAWPAGLLVAGALAPFILLGLCATGHTLRFGLLGLAWSAVTLLPMLLLREVDLHRLGIIPAAGSAILLTSAIEAVGQKRPRAWWILPLAAYLALAPYAIKSGAAWGPGGLRFGELPSWRMGGGDRWWNSLTPEMQALFQRQVQADRAFLEWP